VSHCNSTLLGDIVSFHCLKLSVCIPNRIHSNLHVPLQLLQKSGANSSRCTPPQGSSLSNALCLCLCLSLYVLCISLSLLIGIIWSVLSISQFLCVPIPIFYSVSCSVLRFCSLLVHLIWSVQFY
jgi:hypothetical protein